MRLRGVEMRSIEIPKCTKNTGTHLYLPEHTINEGDGRGGVILYSDEQIDDLKISVIQ